MADGTPPPPSVGAAEEEEEEGEEEEKKRTEEGDEHDTRNPLPFDKVDETFRNPCICFIFRKKKWGRCDVGEKKKKMRWEEDLCTGPGTSERNIEINKELLY